ncbi:hypothetical protein LC087_07355 [Bacillus carboniphilus]|uniref:Uncharacterized protein n=1 Tax=Bacillus carboniphilus TaxID=86663 RepID=A0ABY9JZQ3_9BACI|nr:hypothetical protein [Bacillus carboniphilus]WLR43920.1 hypothetical protein LC087_07355 [Bacillus carboniphilus]
MDQEDLNGANCELGYSLVETMMSFSIWLVTVCVFIPVSSHLYSERMEMKKTIEAYRILFEVKQEKLYERSIILDKKERIGSKFSIQQKEEGEILCVYWERENKIQEICTKSPL